MTPDEIAKRIPDEVVEAAEHEACKNSRPDMRAALAAGLAAWPGLLHDHGFLYDEAENAVILPLQETQNDQG
jgi:hypothetical protein